jgi:hypothetical protein
MRGALAQSETEKRALERRAWRAERQVATARQDGMTELLRIRYLSEAVRTLTERLGRELAPKLAEEAERILAASQSQQRMPSLLELRVMPDIAEMTTTVLEVRIPALACRVALQPNW